MIVNMVYTNNNTDKEIYKWKKKQVELEETIHSSKIKFKTNWNNKILKIDRIINIKIMRPVRINNSDL